MNREGSGWNGSAGPIRNITWIRKNALKPVTVFDERLRQLVRDMSETMYAAPGTGLAANQVGVQRRLFVYDIGDGPVTIINPQIVESDGEWVYDEGCLSVPGLSWDIVRPNATGEEHDALDLERAMLRAGIR